jgi:hypothetical protein
MALDQRRRVSRDRHRLDDVGIERSLGEEPGFPRPLGRGLEHLDERPPDDLPFPLRIRHPLQPAEEQPGGILVLEPDVEIPDENLLNHLGFAGSEQAVVDENAGQLVAHGLVEKRRGDARIDPAAEPEDDAFPPDLGPQLLDRLVEVVAHRPVASAPADPVDEIGDDLAPVRGVDHLRMELQAEKAAGAVLDHRVVGILGGGDDGEIARQPRELVAVRIPDLQTRGNSLEKRAGGIQDGQRPLAVLALLPLLDLAAEEVGEDLDAVTDAENRDLQPEDGPIGERRVLGVHARGPARHDDALGLEGGDLGGRRVVAQDRRVHVALADPAGDHLGVLGAEIEDDDLLGHGV